MINLLIRNGYRPKMLRTCMASIDAQVFKDIHIIMANDSPEAERDCAEVMRLYPGLSIKPLSVTPDVSQPFFWNLYCNDLKAAVTDGWFMYLDNDDYLDNRWCLNALAGQLTGPAQGVICQFRRKTVAKPSNLYWKKIVKGKIGGSCIVLHHTHKNLADWDGERAADYRFITKISEKLPLKWVRLVVVTAGNGGLKGKLYDRKN